MAYLYGIINKVPQWHGENEEKIVNILILISICVHGI